jgi:adenylate cyclase
VLYPAEVSLPSERQVASESGTSVDFVRRVVRAGIVEPIDGGRFAPDAHAVVRTVRALDDAGFAPEVVGQAIADGHLSLQFTEGLAARQVDGTNRTYGEMVASRGDRGRLLGAVYAAFGLPEPEPAVRLSRDEEAIVGEFLDIWSGLSPALDAPARGARIVGESTRRIVEAFLDLWDEVARADWKPDRSTAISAPGGELAARMAALLPSLLGWLEQRHAEVSVQARIIRSFEDQLARLGRLPERPRHQPAIAFVDLAGYTRLTEEAGDELAVRSAVRLQELAAQAAAAHGGRLVKLLGDGVMFRFPSAGPAVRAIADLLPKIRADGLPAGHAGLTSGPVVDRDGDVYGRTVNLAARLSGAAGPDELLVTSDVVELVRSDGFTFIALGETRLRGFDQPIETWRLETERSTGA